MHPEVVEKIGGAASCRPTAAGLRRAQPCRSRRSQEALATTSGCTVFLVVFAGFVAFLPGKNVSAAEIASEALAAFDEIRSSYDMDRYANDPDGAAVGFGAGNMLMTYLSMYEATGDTAHLDRIVFNADRIFANRSDRLGLTDEVRGRSMPAWVTGKYTDGTPHAWLLHASNFLFPVARFAYMVRDDPELRQVYGEDADRYLLEIIEVLDGFEELDWRDGPDPEEGYFGGDPRPAIDPLPFNMMHAAGRAYVALWLATGEERFRDRAERLARFWKNRLTEVEDRHFWNYSTYTTRIEDISHAAWSVDFAFHAYRAGIVFTEEDLQRLANTYRYLARTGSQDHGYVEIDESFENYSAGSLAGQGEWGPFVTVPSQALVVHDPGGTPYGERYARIFRNAAGQPDSEAVRARNPAVRPFSQDGVAEWSMRNNNPDAGGRFLLRLPVNSGTSNLFGVEFRHDTDTIVIWQADGNLTVPFALPSEWTDWRVDFSTSSDDPADRFVNLTVRRSADQDVILSLENLDLASPIAQSWDGVENFYAFDIASQPGGDLVHDVSIDRIQTRALLEGSGEDVVIGFARNVDGSGDLSRSTAAHRWLHLAWIAPDLRPLYLSYFTHRWRHEHPLQMLHAAAYLAETAQPFAFETPVPPAGSFAAWLAEHFSREERADPGISGPDADPAGTGIPNRLRYVLGLGPYEAGRDRLPAVFRDSHSGNALIRIRRDTSATEGDFVIQSSDNLSHWTDVSDFLEVAETVSDGNLETITFRDNREAPARRFYRLQVDY